MVRIQSEYTIDPFKSYSPVNPISLNNQQTISGRIGVWIYDCEVEYKMCVIW